MTPVMCLGVNPRSGKEGGRCLFVTVLYRSISLAYVPRCVASIADGTYTVPLIVHAKLFAVFLRCLIASVRMSVCGCAHVRMKASRGPQGVHVEPPRSPSANGNNDSGISVTWPLYPTAQRGGLPASFLDSVRPGRARAWVYRLADH